MKRCIVVIMALIFLSGCTMYSAKQIDEFKGVIAGGLNNDKAIDFISITDKGKMIDIYVALQEPANKDNFKDYCTKICKTISDGINTAIVTSLSVNLMLDKDLICNWTTKDLRSGELILGDAATDMTVTY